TTLVVESLLFLVTFASAVPTVQASAPSQGNSNPQATAPSSPAGSNPQSRQSGTPNLPPVTGSGVNENKPGVDAGASHTTTEPKKAPLKIGIAQITHSAGL